MTNNDGEEARVINTARDRYQKHNEKILRETASRRSGEMSQRARCACPLCTGRGYLVSRVQVFKSNKQPIYQATVLQVCDGCNGYGVLT